MAENKLQKRWFSDGPAMSYPRGGRVAFWAVNLLMYVLLNMFYSRMQTGVWLQLGGVEIPTSLIEQLLWPVNVFHFPWQIVVIGLVAALACAVPIITAQFYNLLCAVPFVLAVLVVGHNPMLSLCLFVSCAAVSFEPMRFKSKFVSAVVCLTPVLLYWGFYSGENPQPGHLKWAVLYAPWVLAFFVCLLIFGVVLTVGHVLRYRPGIVTPVFGLLLAGTVTLFHCSIGMNERDFQAEVYRSSPSHVAELQDHSIVPLLEEELAQRRVVQSYLTEDVIMSQLRMEWRSAFILGPSVAMALEGMEDLSDSSPAATAVRKLHEIGLSQVYAIDQINRFIVEHEGHERVADAMYYKALLYDMKVNLRALRDDDMLRFYYDTPSGHSELIWREILDRFGESEVSIEARWRLARLLAARKPKGPMQAFGFDEALGLLDEAYGRCRSALKRRQSQAEKQAGRWSRWLGGVFGATAPAITDEQLAALEVRIGRLMTLIGRENRTGHRQDDARVAELAGLDRQQLYYEERLRRLTFEPPQPDPLIDNIELARAMLLRKSDERALALAELAEHYGRSDGGIDAMLELVLMLLDERDLSEDAGQRERFAAECEQYLRKVVQLRPEGFQADYARRIAENNRLELPVRETRGQ